MIPFEMTRIMAFLTLLAAPAACTGRVPLGPANLPQPAAGTGDRGQQTADLGGVPLQVFTYRPTGCTVAKILIVLHGLDRNADTYRDDAIPLARRFCMLVVAPLFDEQRFPTWRYQRGGIVHDGIVQPPASWTVALVSRLVAWARAQQRRPDLPYALLGHSAGGQFLSRVAAYGQDDDATRMVIANPSTWVRASLDIPAPYGFGGLYTTAEREAALRRYLAAPITVLLGREDMGSRNLANSDEAEEQGATRFARGENVFREAERAAHERGWTFNWRLAVVPGVGHDARAMFASDAAFAAL